VTYEGKTQKLDIPSAPQKLNVASLAGAAWGALTGSTPEALIRKPSGTKADAQQVQIWQLNDSSRNRAAEVFDLLETVWRTKQRVDVTTQQYGLISGMVLTGVSAPTKLDTGDGGQFSLSFEQIRTVNAKSVDAPKPLEKMGQKRKPVGSKAAKAISDEESRREAISLPASIWDLAVNGGLGGH
jgi:hypothetical protein